MGLRGVSGHELRAIAAQAATQGPRPTPTEPDGAQDAAPPARAGPETREAQKPQAADVKPPQERPEVGRSGTRMRIDAATRRIVAQIMNQNNEVIKQIPPEELLKIAARFRELQGILFDKQA